MTPAEARTVPSPCPRTSPSGCLSPSRHHLRPRGGRRPFPEVLSADPDHPDLPEAQDRWSPASRVEPLGTTYPRQAEGEDAALRLPHDRHLVLTVASTPPSSRPGRRDRLARQGEWMLGPRCATARTGSGVGGRLEAFTGCGRLGFLDTMVITAGSRRTAARCCTPAGSCGAPAIFEVAGPGREPSTSCGARSSTCRWACSDGPAGRWSPVFAAGRRSLKGFAPGSRSGAARPAA